MCICRCLSIYLFFFFFFFFFKQKTAYEMRISDWSSDVCSSDLNFWDFISLTPESMHMVMWIMSDRAIPRSFRFMEGFGVHTFRLVDAENQIGRASCRERVCQYV